MTTKSRMEAIMKNKVKIQTLNKGTRVSSKQEWEQNVYNPQKTFWVIIGRKLVHYSKNKNWESIDYPSNSSFKKVIEGKTLLNCGIWQPRYHRTCLLFAYHHVVAIVMQ